MHFDFEDFRPDPPRVPAVISRREGVLLSLIAHLVAVIVVLVAPSSFFAASDGAVVVPPPPREEPIRYVHVEPLVERPAPPRPEAPQSDLDRRSATIERPPDAIDPEPFSRGNTPERIVGAPEERATGLVTPPAPEPPEPGPPPPPEGNGFLLTESPPVAPPSGSLGESLRDLQRHLNQQNVQAQRGGSTEFGPDIQFDSRGIDFGPWIRRFRAQVYSNWNVPQAALINSGRVVIQFDLYLNGRIANIRIVQPSAIVGFNNAALNAIRMSNPTLPLPDEYPVEPVVFTVTFRYNDGAPAGP
jgi:TonB family protein